MRPKPWNHDGEDKNYDDDDEEEEEEEENEGDIF